MMLVRSDLLTFNKADCEGQQHLFKIDREQSRIVRAVLGAVSINRELVD